MSARKSEKDILEDKLGISNQVVWAPGLQWGSIQDPMFYISFLACEINGMDQSNDLQSFVLFCLFDSRRLLINELILLC